MVVLVAFCDAPRTSRVREVPNISFDERHGARQGRTLADAPLVSVVRVFRRVSGRLGANPCPGTRCGPCEPTSPWRP